MEERDLHWMKSMLDDLNSSLESSPTKVSKAPSMESKNDNSVIIAVVSEHKEPTEEQCRISRTATVSSPDENVILVDDIDTEKHESKTDYIEVLEESLHTLTSVNDTATNGQSCTTVTKDDESDKCKDQETKLDDIKAKPSESEEHSVAVETNVLSVSITDENREDSLNSTINFPEIKCNDESCASDKIESNVDNGEICERTVSGTSTDDTSNMKQLNDNAPEVGISEASKSEKVLDTDFVRNEQTEATKNDKQTGSIEEETLPKSDVESMKVIDKDTISKTVPVLNDNDRHETGPEKGISVLNCEDLLTHPVNESDKTDLRFVAKQHDLVKTSDDSALVEKEDMPDMKKTESVEKCENDAINADVTKTTVAITDDKNEPTSSPLPYHLPSISSASEVLTNSTKTDNEDNSKGSKDSVPDYANKMVRLASNPAVSTPVGQDAGALQLPQTSNIPQSFILSFPFNSNQSTPVTPSTSFAKPNLCKPEDSPALKTCELCGFQTTDAGQLANHRSSKCGRMIPSVVPAGGLPTFSFCNGTYNCSGCAFHTSKRRLFVVHVCLHLVTDPCRCNYCNYATHNLTDINNHVISCHPGQKRTWKILGNDLVTSIMSKLGSTAPLSNITFLPTKKNPKILHRSGCSVTPEPIIMNSVSESSKYDDSGEMGLKIVSVESLKDAVDNDFGADIVNNIVMQSQYNDIMLSNIHNGNETVDVEKGHLDISKASNITVAKQNPSEKQTEKDKIDDVSTGPAISHSVKKDLSKNVKCYYKDGQYCCESCDYMVSDNEKDIFQKHLYLDLHPDSTVCGHCHKTRSEAMETKMCPMVDMVMNLLLQNKKAAKGIEVKKKKVPTATLR